MLCMRSSSRSVICDAASFYRATIDADRQHEEAGGSAVVLA